MDYSLPGSYVHGIFQARYWSELPFPSPGDLPDPGIEHGSPALLADALLSEPPGKSMKVKQKSEKVGLKLNGQKTKIMASRPLTSWQTDGETVADLIWGAPKSLQMVTAARKLKDACSLEEKL